jgi:hypothetical protein
MKEELKLCNAPTNVLTKIDPKHVLGGLTVRSFAQKLPVQVPHIDRTLVVDAKKSRCQVRHCCARSSVCRQQEHLMCALCFKHFMVVRSRPECCMLLT